MRIGRTCALTAMVTLTGVMGAANGGTVVTNEVPMMDGRNLSRTDALMTVGEFTPDGHQLTGIPDGIGAMPWDADTVRIFINHEFSVGSGTPWMLDNGTVFTSGARVSYLDIDKATRGVAGGGQAIKRVIDWTGNEIDASDLPGFPLFNRFCSSNMHGPEEGFSEYLYFTGEETSGGRMWVLDPLTGDLFELADLGNGAWENVTVIPTAGTAAAGKTVILLSDDSAGRPAYLYVGDKSPGSTDILVRNGLVGGQLYAFALDSGANTNTEFQGTGTSASGTWIPLTSNDPTADDVANMNALVTEAGALGAFFFSRPEDVAYDTRTPGNGVAVLASTGRVTNLGDIDGDGNDDEINDPWGTTYLISVDPNSIVGGGSVTGALTVIYDGNEADKQDFGIRSPDNLDWADDGFIYVQEDRSVGGFGADSGREASVWRLDPDTFGAVHILEMNRSAVPAGQTDFDPTDLGDWESSGILDVSTLFDEPGLFLYDVQAHSLGGGVIDTDGLVQGGQINFLDLGATEETPAIEQMGGLGDAITSALLTVGERVKDGDGLYHFTGIPDGIGAAAWDDDVVRFWINHEFSAGSGSAWPLANGTVLSSGARVSYLDVSKTDRSILGGGLAIESIVDWEGTIVDAATVGGFGVLNRLCSSGVAGPDEGLADIVYLTGEENSGGRAWALDTATGIFYELADFGNGAWENFTIVPTVGTAFANHTVMLLADDSAGRPAYLYVGEKNAAGDFLERNGLVGGQLYAFVLDSGANTNVEFQGTGTTGTGTWVPLASNDPTADDVANMNALVTEAGAAGAFFFSRPEDVAFDPTNPSAGRVVFASTGRVTNLGDIDGDGNDDEIDDPWGTTYLITVDVETLGDATPTGALTVVYDGNEPDKQDFGIRSPDNLDWADNGFVYIQEDRSVGGFGLSSGREASIWRLDIKTAMATRVGEMNREAVPPGLVDIDPDDVGDWESSGILDVTSLFDLGEGGEPSESLFIFDTQAHSLRGGIIDADDLEQGGQLLWMRDLAKGTCPTDTDGDGTVSFTDLLNVLSNWGACGNGPCSADVNDDGVVNFGDLLQVLANWGDC